MKQAKVQLLKAKMAEHGYTLDKLCAEIGVPTNTFIRRRANDTFTVTDVRNMSAALHLTMEDVHNIFLA